jgi:hypothetical protein
LAAGLSHEAAVVTGVTLAPFTTDQITLQLNGAAGRVSLSVFGAYTAGSTLAGQPGSYTAAAATAQVNYGLARCCGIFANFNYYDHQLRDVSALPVEFPATYGRHAIRVGLSYWLPLYGSF